MVVYMKYTELEFKVMEMLGKPNDNGETIGVNYGDYICLFNFGIENKRLRGVLASLVKKDIIIIWDDGDGEVIELTENGFNVIANYLYK